MRKEFRSALLLLAGMTMLTGIVYPLAVTGLSAVLFPDRARGSLLAREGEIVGSALIGQRFSDPRYFWGRPSATSPEYNGAASAGSNLGPLNPALIDRVRARVAALRSADPGNESPIPIDLVTASGSGLDPHLSPAGAYYQVPRVARSRGLDEAAVLSLVERHIQGRQFGFLGEPRVSILELNLSLDAPAGPR